MFQAISNLLFQVLFCYPVLAFLLFKKPHPKYVNNDHSCKDGGLQAKRRYRDTTLLAAIIETYTNTPEVSLLDDRKNKENWYFLTSA